MVRKDSFADKEVLTSAIGSLRGNRLGHSRAESLVCRRMAGWTEARLPADSSSAIILPGAARN